MLEDFFFRALLGGIGVAIVAGPVGCFIIWRRLAYFGDTLSHSALLGVAMALLLELNITLSVFFISLIVSLLLLLLQKRASLSSDALLGLLAHATLAVGLVVLAFMTWVRVDLMGFLFGDILAVTTSDLAVIWFGGLAVLISLSFIWRRLFAATVNYELAKAEGAKPDFTNIVFMGTLVKAGRARGVVAHVGVKTQFGKIFLLMQDQEKKRTPLQEAMDDLGAKLSFWSVAFIAGIVAIPQEYFEAAKIDGATAFQNFWNVTLPLLKPASVTVIILSLIGGLRSFDLIWAMTKGGPGFTSDVIASVIFKQYQAGFYGLSSAGNVVLFLVVTAIIVPIFWLLNRKETEL